MEAFPLTAHGIFIFVFARLADKLLTKFSYSFIRKTYIILGFGVAGLLILATEFSKRFTIGHFLTRTLFFNLRFLKIMFLICKPNLELFSNECFNNFDIYNDNVQFSSSCNQKQPE